ncbi:uncharacterized protein LOC132047564 [Lycium ferocissimum]|uniref:uncharacterized protein LOC132047564 n=1 Tax=Lycium ferocissimum TaxID=112874 RepID=UPI002816778B|nr:uncharacterized protein LOC132047564 [Lycium ferocissimum]
MVFWDSNYNCNIVEDHVQHLTLQVHHIISQFKFHVSIVYAIKARTRQDLYESLNQLNQQLIGPWSVMGYFNVIMESSEKKRGRRHRLCRSLDFINCMEKCEMMDAGYSGKFLDIVKISWLEHIEGTYMYIMQQKLKRLAHKLSNWSKSSISNVFDKVKELENQIEVAENIYEVDDADQNRSNLQALYAEQIRWMNMENSILKQKDRVKWEEGGDSNTKYFHSVVRQKRKRAYLHRIKDENGQWIQADNVISEAAIRHFNHLFTQPQQNHDFSFLKRIDPMVNKDDN